MVSYGLVDSDDSFSETSGVVRDERTRLRKRPFIVAFPVEEDREPQEVYPYSVPVAIERRDEQLIPWELMASGTRTCFSKLWSGIQYVVIEYGGRAVDVGIVNGGNWTDDSCLAHNTEYTGWRIPYC